MAKSVLIVEDDQNIADLLRLYLEKEGYVAAIAPDGGAGVEMFRKLQPDLVLLDVMLPVLDGWGVLRSIRQESRTPVIMLTAKGETIDKVLALELGADDFIVKPFDAKELIARIKAVIRRSENTAEPAAEILRFPDLDISLATYTVEYCGKKLELPPKELELLYFLAQHPNKVFTREQLLQKVWEFDFYGDSRTVDVHIKRLREKLSTEGVEHPWQIKTVWGVGYKFEVI